MATSYVDGSWTREPDREIERREWKRNMQRISRNSSNKKEKEERERYRKRKRNGNSMPERWRRYREGTDRAREDDPSLCIVAVASTQGSP